jgi:UDP-glucose 4-epimerase
MNILVTGGAGYIGSHTLVELAIAGYNFIVYDNLSNSSAESIRRVETIINKKIIFIKGDIRDKKTLETVFTENKIDSVIHFAGLKAVGESVEKPLEYYDNNIAGTLNLLEVMKENHCKKIVFSSSATVYGDPKFLPITEDHPLSTTNPYGASKLMIESILNDLQKSDFSWKISILRYFNPVGAHESGKIGEDPLGIPNNLMPFVAQVAVGKREKLSVFGNDYDTVDGTGVRDYIHVVDLANAHVKAIQYLNKIKISDEPLITNIGTGVGYSVLEIVEAYQKASNKKIPFKIIERRAGDIASCYANPEKAKKVLNWEAKFGIEKMCKDSWRWQSENPEGYKK